jgi:hypothetical protein
MISILIISFVLIHYSESQTLSTSGIKTTLSTDTTRLTFGSLSSSAIAGGETTIATTVLTTSNLFDTECPNEVKTICLNGSTCKLVEKYTFKCFCKSGFSGYDCGTVDDSSDGKLFCQSSPCKNDSTCIQISLTSGVCFCSDRFSGQFCETRF